MIADISFFDAFIIGVVGGAAFAVANISTDRLLKWIGWRK